MKPRLTHARTNTIYRDPAKPQLLKSCSHYRRTLQQSSRPTNMLNASFVAASPRPEVDDRQYGEQEERIELNLRLSLLDGRVSHEVGIEDVFAP